MGARGRVNGQRPSATAAADRQTRCRSQIGGGTRGTSVNSPGPGQGQLRLGQRFVDRVLALSLLPCFAPENTRWECANRSPAPGAHIGPVDASPQRSVCPRGVGRRTRPDPALDRGGGEPVGRAGRIAARQQPRSGGVTGAGPGRFGQREQRQVQHRDVVRGCVRARVPGPQAARPIPRRRPGRDGLANTTADDHRRRPSCTSGSSWTSTAAGVGTGSTTHGGPHEHSRSCRSSALRNCVANVPTRVPAPSVQASRSRGSPSIGIVSTSR